MRIKGTDVDGRLYAAYLNNQPLKWVVEADDEEGYVIVLLRDANDHLIKTKDGICRFRLHGQVNIVRRDDEEAKARLHTAHLAEVSAHLAEEPQ